MPDVITTPDTWYVRPLEKLLGGLEVADYPLKSTYTPSANPIFPGYVAVLLDGELELADDALSAGAFTGLFMTEINDTIGDETAGGMTNPVILQGPAIVKIAASVLDTGSWDTAATAVDLIANGGKLKMRESETTPTVAHLQKVNTDGSVIIQLLEPSTYMRAAS